MLSREFVGGSVKNTSPLPVEIDKFVNILAQAGQNSVSFDGNRTMFSVTLAQKLQKPREKRRNSEVLVALTHTTSASNSARVTIFCTNASIKGHTKDLTVMTPEVPKHAKNMSIITPRDCRIFSTRLIELRS